MKRDSVRLDQMTCDGFQVKIAIFEVVLDARVGVTKRQNQHVIIER